MLAGALACVSQRFQKLAQRPAQGGRTLADLQRAAGKQEGAVASTSSSEGCQSHSQVCTCMGCQPPATCLATPCPPPKGVHVNVGRNPLGCGQQLQVGVPGEVGVDAALQGMAGVMSF